jgi:purine-binding chemotaxis protein CheW
MTLDDHNGTGSNSDANRYLVFRVGSESLATPLLSIREIVEPLPYRAVPNPHDYYLGLANLRGQIVGVIDLGIRLKFDPVVGTPGGAFLVFDVDGVCMAAYVTRVETVLVIEPSAISKGDQIDTVVPSRALVGIAQARDRLIPIIELSGLLESAPRQSVSSF